MAFEFTIARRYLSTRRKPPFVSLILTISLLSVATGVFALIFVLSVMNGFEKDFRGRILSFKAPVTVTSGNGEDLSARADEFKAMDSRIRRVVPFAEGEAVAQTRDGGVLGLRVRGIAEAPEESRLGRYYESESFGAQSIVIGDGLSDSLHVHPDFAEDVRLIFPLGDVGPSGDVLPRIKSFKTTGIFHSGFYEYDSKYAVIPYVQALGLFGDQSRTGLEIWLDRPEDAESVQKVLEGKKSSTDLKVLTWKDSNPKLFAAMKLEKIGMFLLLGMLLLIAAFNIFGLISLTVLDKTADMAALRAIGLRRRGVSRIFLLQSAAIGVIGTAVGGGLGLLASWILTKYPAPLPTSYYLEHLPIAVEAGDAAVILALVPLVTILAAIYPARQAAKIPPARALRYE